jgi:hypothetical protein
MGTLKATVTTGAAAPAVEGTSGTGITVTVMEMIPGQSQIELRWPPAAQTRGPNLVAAQTDFIEFVIGELKALIPTLPG